ncbi:MAG: PLP-dependent aminotransferase family protein [Oscillospiraceae bacterium]|jgi:2-aminoadipate transaminase|nr:PLP-dependent aminotransferase family protein [Oscillospiraceae bacterium]
MNHPPIAFAHRFDGISGSAIRDIFKLLGQPGMISFAGGNPSDAALEDGLLSDLAQDVLARHGKKLLQYGASEGWAPYREETARFLREEIGVQVDPSEVLPTTGSTQAIDLLLKALIDPGDVILVEGPSFLGTLQAMRLYGAKLVSVAMDAQGIDLSALEEAIKAHHPKLLYTVPNFQNPTGVTLATERRQAIAALAARYNLLIAEDDPYRGLRYRGEALPSIFSFDEEARVIYLTSFSKLISPGMRVGAVATKHPELMRKLVIGKQSTDVHTPGLTQAMAAEYLERGLLPAHVTGICARYREQLSHMMQGFEAFPAGVSVNAPDGGLFVWATLPEGMDAVALLKKAVAKGVAYVPGSYFYADGGHLNTLRLNFSNAEPEAIDRGMALLAETVAEAL